MRHTVAPRPQVVPAPTPTTLIDKTEPSQCSGLTSLKTPKTCTRARPIPLSRHPDKRIEAEILSTATNGTKAAGLASPFGRPPLVATSIAVCFLPPFIAADISLINANVAASTNVV